MEEIQSNLFDERHELRQASKGKRLANYLIDFVVFYAIIFVIAIIAPGIVVSDGEASLAYYLIAIIVIVGYYTVLEGSTGKSLGKMVTGTKVVTENGNKITYKDAFMRSLSRLVPFEALSIFFGAGMWHDRWTETQVVEAN